MKKLLRNIYNLFLISTKSFIIFNYIKNYFFYYRKKKQCKNLEQNVYLNFKTVDESEKWFTNNLYFLYKNLFNIKVNKLLEIGSYEGRSALFFSFLFKNAHITCVDTWSGSDEHYDHNFELIEKNFDANTKVLKTSNKLNKFKSSSDFFFENNNKYFDFIYVDGDHSKDQVLRDLENSWNRLNKNGFLLIDDYMWWYYKNLKNNPASSVNIFINKNINQISNLVIWHQVLIQKK